ncbi:MAG: chemotaxis protein CheR, partial [Anaerolineae bacterium]|nr:chemotaxis protein CheR [Anaerolineae bacterium]
MTGKKEQHPQTQKETADRAALPESPAAAQSAGVPAADEGHLDFPIVGIGASAGGLKAFETFFDHVPADSGIAFVLIQHLSTQHESILDDLIRRHAQIEVSEVEDGVAVQPN